MTLLRIVQWFKTFYEPRTFNWIHRDGKVEKLTRKQIRYTSWKRTWYVKR